MFGSPPLLEVLDPPMTQPYLSYQTVLSPENRLYKDLMVNYNKNIRPMMDPNQVMKIRVFFSLKKIEGLVSILEICEVLCLYCTFGLLYDYKSDSFILAYIIM
jgi:hypothetical protein